MSTQNELFNLFILRNNASKKISIAYDHIDTYCLTSMRFWPQVIFYARLPNRYDHPEIGDKYQGWMGPTFAAVLLMIMGGFAYKFISDEIKLWIKGQFTDEFLLAFYAKYYADNRAGLEIPREECEEEADYLLRKTRTETLNKMIEDYIGHDEAGKKKIGVLKKIANENRLQINTEILNSETDTATKAYSSYDRLRWYFDGMIDLTVHYAYTHWIFWMVSTIILYQIIDNYCENPEDPDRSNHSGAFTDDVVGHGAMLWLQCFIGVFVAIVAWYYAKYKEDEERERLLPADQRHNLVKGQGWKAIFAPFQFLFHDKFAEAMAAKAANEKLQSPHRDLRAWYLKNFVFKKDEKLENYDIAVETAPEDKKGLLDKNKLSPANKFAQHMKWTNELTIATNFISAFLLFNVAAWPATVFFSQACGITMGDPDTDNGAPAILLTFLVTSLFSAVYAKYQYDDIVKTQKQCAAAIDAGYDPSTLIDKQKDTNLQTFWWDKDKNRHYGAYFIIGRSVGNGGFLLMRILFMGGFGNLLLGLIDKQDFYNEAIDRGDSDHHFDDKLLLIGFVATFLLIALNMRQYRQKEWLNEIASDADDKAIAEKAPGLTLTART